MALVTRPFRSGDVDAAAELLAARHRRDRARLGMIPARFDAAEACAGQLREAMERADGLVAERDGRLAGFMFALAQFTAPDRPNARFQPLRSALFFSHGHAVDAAEDAFAVYAELYAEHSGRLRDRGIVGHTVHLPAGDPVLDAVWSDLGFGRSGAFAARDLSPLPRAGAPGVEVREATPEDIEIAVRLVDEEARYHALPPVFHAYIAPDAVEAARSEMAELLASAEGTGFLGIVGGREVGLVTTGPGRGAPFFVPDDAFTLGEAAVLAEARGRGVGVTLVERALAWGRERECGHVVLHFSIGNRLSRPFWLGLGFTPLLWHLTRHLDPRVTWAHE
jgi:GNAT superfamily N-acetyltransferase/predicted GNAT superfamily acetyltransferase